MADAIDIAVEDAIKSLSSDAIDSSGSADSISDHYEARLKQSRYDVIMLEETAKVITYEVDKQYKVKIIIENDYSRSITFPILHNYVICKRINGNYRKILSIFWVPCDEACGVFHITSGPEFDAVSKVKDLYSYEGEPLLSYNTEGSYSDIMNWAHSDDYDSD